MRPRSSFVLHCEIEKPIHERVEDCTLRAEPRSSWTLRVDPNVENLLSRGGDRASNGYVGGFHYRFPCFLGKNFSRRSGAALPDGSSFRKHLAPSPTGADTEQSPFSPPPHARA